MTVRFPLSRTLAVPAILVTVLLTLLLFGCSEDTDNITAPTPTSNPDPGLHRITLPTEAVEYDLSQALLPAQGGYRITFLETDYGPSLVLGGEDNGAVQWTTPLSGRMSTVSLAWDGSVVGRFQPGSGGSQDILSLDPNGSVAWQQPVTGQPIPRPEGGWLVFDHMVLTIDEPNDAVFHLLDSQGSLQRTITLSTYFDLSTPVMLTPQQGVVTGHRWDLTGPIPTSGPKQLLRLDLTTESLVPMDVQWLGQQSRTMHLTFYPTADGNVLVYMYDQGAPEDQTSLLLVDGVNFHEIASHSEPFAHPRVLATGDGGALVTWMSPVTEGRLELLRFGSGLTEQWRRSIDLHDDEVYRSSLRAARVNADGGFSMLVSSRIWMEDDLQSRLDLIHTDAEGFVPDP